MAIFQNKATELGDVIIIKTDIPVIGIVALMSFIDSTTNETANRYFDREFRYSLDGVTFSDFLALTNDNLQTINVTVFDTFVIEYRYRRSGSDSSDYIAFDDVTLNAEFEDIPTGIHYQNSIFSKYIDRDGLCSIAWSINVLEKLYKKGILPEYIERGRADSNEEDRDFLDFWRSITHYFALYVCLARYFKDFYKDRDLLLEYIKERGLFVCEDEISPQDLLYLMNYYYDEIRQRGTRQIFRKKGSYLQLHTDIADTLSISHSISSSSSTSNSSSSSNSSNYLDNKEIDGEYLRLICFNIDDDFVYSLISDEEGSWNLGNSSPMYKGSGKNLNLNKFYVDSLSDLELLDLIGTNYCSIVSDYYIRKKVLHISEPASIAGIGYSNPSYWIKVNPNIDYEITFRVKQTDSLGNLTFGCLGYDISGNAVSFEKIETELNSNYFIQRKKINQENYIFVRGIIFRHDKLSAHDTSNSYLKNDFVRNIPTGSNFYKAKRNVPIGISLSNTNYWQYVTSSEISELLTLNIGDGNNLRFKSNIINIIPYIVNDNSTGNGGDLDICDIRINPLQSKYSKYFMNQNNILEIWNVNNNMKYSNDEINDISNKFLLPYGTTLINNFFDSPF